MQKAVTTLSQKTLIYHINLAKNLPKIPPEIPSQVFLEELLTNVGCLLSKFAKNTDPLSVCHDEINQRIKKPNP